jgi:hypothetical protein
MEIPEHHAAAAGVRLVKSCPLCKRWMGDGDMALGDRSGRAHRSRCGVRESRRPSLG